MSRPIAIPGSPHDDDHPQFQEGSVLYGSPGALREYGLSSSVNPSTPDGRIGFRHASSPLGMRRRNDEYPPSRTHDPEQRWTLFGQLMENEGQLPTPSPRSAPTRQGSYFNLRATASRSNLPTIPASGPASRQSLQSNVSEETLIRDAPDYDSVHSAEENAPLNPPPEDPPQSQSRPPRPARKWLSFLPEFSIAHRNILKCAIAYTVASLFTFNPTLSGLVSDLVSYGPGKHTPLPSGHMIATIAVYYNPAKTMGGMIEADLFCFLGLLYAAFVCLGSMGMYWWIEDKHGLDWLADTIVLSWVGISMAAIAFMKVWMSNPSFNTACSMMAIIIFVVIVKEGGLATLLQVMAIVFTGSAIANLVCFFIWPQSATVNLQANMVKTLGSFSTLLSRLTGVFLLDDDDETHYSNLAQLHQAVENHQNSFTTLKKVLGEAQSEWVYRDFNVDEDDSASKGASMIRGEYASHRGYEDAVDSMNRLAQHLNGLRSSTRLQNELTKAGIRRQFSSPGKAKAIEDDASAILHAAADMFGDLVDELGPPLRGLTKACTSTLDRLKDEFTEVKNNTMRADDLLEPQDFAEMAEGIERALFAFESTSNHALLRLYRKGAVSQDLGRRATSPAPSNVISENRLLTDEDNEHVFLVYFFIFTLQEFAGELVSLIDAMERIYLFERKKLMQGSFFYRLYSSISRRFLLFRIWMKKPTGQVGGLRRSLSYIVPQHRIAHTFFPKVRPHAPDTLQTPSRSQFSLWGRIKYTIWELSKVFKQRNVKYAMKAGIAIALLASPAFFDATRPFFVEYQGDWALVSTFVVISPTIGATNMLSFQRVLGTLFGATVAACIYSLFPEDAVVLCIFGFFFSLPCFYFAVTQPKHLAATRFVLLTYNLTCLYCYNLRTHDVWVWDIAVDRATAVTGGVLWASIVSRLWWPAEARGELSKSLGDFCLNLGWLYTRLVASNSFAPEYNPDSPNQQRGESSALAGTSNSGITRLHNSIHEFMAMELHLQIQLIEMQTLLAQAQHEPRLKGPFPVQLYRDILTSLQTILDKLHSMRCVTTREEWYTSVRKDFILPVNRERHEMVGNIILSFSTLASAFRLKAPLPPYLPPAEKSRQRLVNAIRQLDVVKSREIRGSRQLLFFAYAITMKGVTEELERLGKTLQDAFGVIGGASEAFDALFFQAEERHRVIEHVS